jgi:transcriptional regulator with XRE-family HTH domain
VPVGVNPLDPGRRRVRQGQIEDSDRLPRPAVLADRHDPAVASATGPERRELASRLRGLREDAGLSTTRLAAVLGWSQSKVSKIENGRTKPAVSDVEAWLTAVEAPADQRAELLDIAESVQVASIIWDRTLRGGREEHQRTIGRLLDEACDMRVFQSAVVPGLLQTAEYARRVLGLADVFELASGRTAVAGSPAPWRDGISPAPNWPSCPGSRLSASTTAWRPPTTTLTGSRTS